MKLDTIYMAEDWKKLAAGAATGALGLALGTGMVGCKDKQCEPEVAQPKPAPTRPVQRRRMGFNFRGFRQRLRGYEGYRLTRFRVGRRGEIDIGIGHTMSNPNFSNPTAVSRRVFREVFGNEVDFDAVLGGRALTDQQVASLADHDTGEHLRRAQRIFPNFNDYPDYLQFALVDSVYRGDTGSNTTRLINAGSWREAAVEYLNRRDYRNAVSMGIPGIRPRMEANRDAMLQYATENVQEGFNRAGILTLVDRVKAQMGEHPYRIAFSQVMQAYDSATRKQVAQEFGRRSAVARAARAEREYSASQPIEYGGDYEIWQAAMAARREFDHAVAASPRIDAVDASDYISRAAEASNVPYEAVADIFYA